MILRERDMKWIFHFDRRPTQAFNLAKDPLEKEDLAPQLSNVNIQEAEALILRRYLSMKEWWRQR